MAKSQIHVVQLAPNRFVATIDGHVVVVSPGLSPRVGRAAWFLSAATAAEKVPGRIVTGAFGPGPVFDEALRQRLVEDIEAVLVDGTGLAALAERREGLRPFTGEHWLARNAKPAKPAKEPEAVRLRHRDGTWGEYVPLASYKGKGKAKGKEAKAKGKAKAGVDFDITVEGQPALAAEPTGAFEAPTDPGLVEAQVRLREAMEQAEAARWVAWQVEFDRALARGDLTGATELMRARQARTWHPPPDPTLDA